MRTFNSLKIPRPKRNSWALNISGPLYIEVGCGVGLHPILFSTQNKDAHLVAIEHTKVKYEKFYRRYQSHGCPKNLYPVHDNAISVITHNVSKKSVSKYFFLYPNPNPKSSQANKRWYAMPFMEKVIETLVPGGLIELATNEKFYAEEASHYMRNIWGLEEIEFKALDSSFRPRTHFEKKYLERGETCYNLVFMT